MSGLRIQTPDEAFEEDLDRSLRPRTLEDFVGQDGLKDQLAVSLEAARLRGEALDHVLLAGPPGLGKTSLAQIVAAELDVPFVQTAGPALERKGDIAVLPHRAGAALDLLRRRDPPSQPRAGGDLLSGDGGPPAADHRRPGRRRARHDVPLPPFTLVGATTRAGLLTTPLRDRFGIQHRLEPYAGPELAAIVHRSAHILGCAIDEGGAAAIARRSRGTPRVANRLLKRVRDYAEVRGTGVVDVHAADAALDLLEIDDLGLDRLDREILGAICTKFDGGPVGLSTLAVTVGEEQDTIEDVYEPYLLQCGFLKRTPRGRVATSRAYAHLGLEPPAEREQGLF